MTTHSTAFDAFWKTFPCKKAKLAAMKAFIKASKLASIHEILDGVERYKRSKPDYADWCHPATWLNQGRWMDEEVVKQDSKAIGGRF